MSKEKRDAEFCADVSIVCIMFLEMLKSLDVNAKQVIVMEIDESTGDRQQRSLAEVMAGMKEYIADVIMDHDEDSKEAAAKLLAKVGGAA